MGECVFSRPAPASRAWGGCGSRTGRRPGRGGGWCGACESFGRVGGRGVVVPGAAVGRLCPEGACGPPGPGCHTPATAPCPGRGGPMSVPARGPKAAGTGSGAPDFPRAGMPRTAAGTRSGPAVVSRSGPSGPGSRPRHSPPGGPETPAGTGDRCAPTTGSGDRPCSRGGRPGLRSWGSRWGGRGKEGGAIAVRLSSGLGLGGCGSAGRSCEIRHTASPEAVCGSVSGNPAAPPAPWAGRSSASTLAPADNGPQPAS